MVFKFAELKGKHGAGSGGGMPPVRGHSMKKSPYFSNERRFSVDSILQSISSIFLLWKRNLVAM
jgi:hypothetical protein